MDPEITHPTEADVLFGRCRVCFNHVGNIRFRCVIQSRAREYQGVTSRRDKSRIVYSVVQHVQNYGGRFLKRDKNEDWHVVSLAEAIQKVGHSLRDKKSGFPDENPLDLKKAPKNMSAEKKPVLLSKVGEVRSDQMEISAPQEEEKGEPKPSKKPSRGPLRKRHKLERIAEYNAKNKELSLGTEEEDCAKTILEMSSMLNSSKAEDSERAVAVPVEAKPSVEKTQKKNVRRFKLGGPIFGNASHLQGLSSIQTRVPFAASNPFNIPIARASLASLHSKVPASSSMSATIQPPGDKTSEKGSLLKRAVTAAEISKDSNVSISDAANLLLRGQAMLAAANYQKETLLATYHKEAEARRLLAEVQAQAKVNAASYPVVPGFSHLRNPAWRHFTM